MKKPCKTCGKIFSSAPCEKQIFCSIQCVGKWYNYLKPKNCENCGSIFKPYNSKLRFCSCTCRGEFQSVIAREKSRKYCLQCDKAFHPTSSKSKFCCRACCTASRRGEEPTSRHIAGRWSKSHLTLQLEN